MKVSTVLIGLAMILTLEVAFAAPQYEIDNVIEVQSSPECMFFPRWDHTGQRLVYYSWPSGDIYLSDVTTDPATKTRLVQRSEVPVRGAPLAWSPDGNFILFTVIQPESETPDQCRIAKCSTVAPDTVTYEAVMPSDLGLSNERYDVREPFVILTSLGYKLLVASLDWGGSDNGIYCLEVDNAGTRIPGTAVEIVDTGANLRSPRLSPDCDTLFLEQPWTHTSTRLWVISGILDVLNGQAQPVESLTDPRVHRLDTDGLAAGSPQASQDGTLVFHCVDINGVYDAREEGNLSGADFEIVVTSLADVIADNPNPYVIAEPGNQGQANSSSGGTRFVYVDVTEQNEGRLYLAALRISDQLSADESGVVEEDFSLVDGAGTVLFVPAGTVVSQDGTPQTGPVSISMYTPISPLEEILLTVPGGVPVRRVFEPEGLDLVVPDGLPVTLTISYTDAEVEGLDETELELVEIRPGSVQNLEVIERNPEENYIVGSITGFSEFAVTVVLDSDDDGLLDDWETRDLDPETEGVQNPFDPLVADSTGDNGQDTPDGKPDGSNDYDGDGMTNRQEFTFGTDPTDPDSWVELPLFPMVSRSLLALLLLIAAVARTRGRGVASVEETPLDIRGQSPYGFRSVRRVDS